jgi:hypothetical protein
VNRLVISLYQGIRLGKFKDYFCKVCDRQIAPLELITTKDKDGNQQWQHKECGEKKIVRIDRKDPVVTKSKAKDKDELEDMFE